MASTVLVDDKASEVISDVVDIIYGELGIKLRQKDIIPMVFRDPKDIAEIVKKNLKYSIKV